MAQIIRIEDLERPPHGDQLDELVRQLDGLKKMKEILDSEGVWLSTKEGYVFGQLTSDEAKAPRDRIREKITGRISQVIKEIRRQTEMPDNNV